MAEKENADINSLICFDEPTKMMKETISKCGMYKQGINKFDKIQILTVKDIIRDKRFFIPFPIHKQM